VAVNWKDFLDADDLDDAKTQLLLLFGKNDTDQLLGDFQQAENVTWKPKELFYASGRDAAPADDLHVAKVLGEIKAGKALTPVMLVRGDYAEGLPLLFANGWHRACAIEATDIGVDIPCRIVKRP